MRGAVLGRLAVQLVCGGGPGPRPAGQPHPEGAAAAGAAGHQPGEAPGVPAAAVHQHPLPGRRGEGGGGERGETGVGRARGGRDYIEPMGLM